MPHSYNPKDADNSVIPAGVYPASIIKVEESFAGPQSKTPGAPMAVFTFKVFGPETIVLKDRIVLKSALWKLKALATALNILDKFNGGTFRPTDYERLNLKVEIGVSKYQGADQNQIEEYMPSGYSEALAKSDTKQQEEYADKMPRDDGDIPPF